MANIVMEEKEKNRKRGHGISRLEEMELVEYLSSPQAILQSLLKERKKNQSPQLGSSSSYASSQLMAPVLGSASSGSANRLLGPELESTPSFSANHLLGPKMGMKGKEPIISGPSQVLTRFPLLPNMVRNRKSMLELNLGMGPYAPCSTDEARRTREHLFLNLELEGEYGGNKRRKLENGSSSTKDSGEPDLELRL